ncbi:hypothetical protein HDU80_006841 [Chytriomyces hyalinus]|nr:hypothetical protein HDU80_006841 [Chytriomyces hyalinus]
MANKFRDCTFSFTPDLVLDAHLSASLAFLQDVKDFFRDRADAEREHAKRLDLIAKKYSAKFEKRSLLGRSGASEDAFNPQNSVELAWKKIVDATEHRSKTHLNYADSLSAEIGDKIKLVISKKDESRKKHMAFSQRLSTEREAGYCDKDKCKKKYDDACENYEAAKVRHERAADDKAREKYALLLHSEILEMNNRKNMYILSIAAANAVKNEYFTVEVPNLLQDLHALSESVFDSLRKVWENYAILDSNHLHALLTHTTSVLIPSITSIDPKQDTLAFMQCNPQTSPSAFSRLTPKDFVYIPSPMWRDANGMASDAHSRCYMINKLVKVKRKLEQVERDMMKHAKGIEGTEKLHEVYVKNPEQGDMDDVFDKILEIRREHSILSILKAKLQANIEAIISGVGDAKPDDVFHNFHNCSYAIPTSCNSCRQVIWGVGKPGLSCKECGVNVHVKCELKVPPTCSQSKCMYRSNSLKSFSSPAAHYLQQQKHLPMAEKSPTRSNAVVLVDGESGGHHSLGDMRASTQGAEAPQTVGGDAIVLYDYAPPMNADVEELAVMEGEICQVLEVDDGGGWTKVRCGGKTGLIPSAYIKHRASVSLNPMDSACEFKQPSQYAPYRQEDEIETKEFNGVVGIKTTVLFDFLQSAADEISIKAGQDVWVLDEDEGSGWITVNDGAREGLVPTTYLKWV